MKYIMVFLLLFILGTACKNQEDVPTLEEDQDTLEYYIQQMKANGLDTQKDEELLENEELYAGFSKYSYEYIDSVVAGFVQLEEEANNEENQFWNAVRESGRYDEYVKQFEAMESLDDMRQLVEDYPEITERIGLKADYEKRVQQANEQEDKK